MKKAKLTRPRVRRRWAINPKTRVKEDKKRYKRQIIKNQTQKLLKETDNG